MIAERDRLIAEQHKLVKLMEEQLRLARQRRFGSSSEKQPHQGDFFDEAELEVASATSRPNSRTRPPVSPKPNANRATAFQISSRACASSCR